MNVLLAIDAQNFSVKTAAYAIRYAKQMGADLHIVAVLSRKDTEENPKLVKATTILMSRIRTEASDEDVASRMLLQTGTPINELLLEADRIKAETIILGASNKSTIDRMIIGSVSEEIIKRAKCPVIIVK